MKKLVLLLGLSTLFYSCTKVIDVDLNEANPQNVIEANLYEGKGDFEVKISKTTSYFDNKQPTPVTNAQIALIKGNTSEQLTHVGDGIYALNNVTILAGEKLSVKVNVGSELFEATSVMPNKVLIDTLEYSKEDDNVTLKWNDPGDEKNYYRIIRKLNNEVFEESESAVIRSDRVRNGNEMEHSLFQDRFFGSETDSSILRTGDTVTVYLQSIDKATFDYFDGLNSLNGGGGFGDATPANPTSNWSNKGLGYLGVRNQDIKQIVIP